MTFFSHVLPVRLVRAALNDQPEKNVSGVRIDLLGSGGEVERLSEQPPRHVDGATGPFTR